MTDAPEGGHTMYTDINFKSKKELKDALAADKKITCYSPGPFPCATEGWITIEGPHSPQPHKWCGQARLVNGLVVQVK